MISVKHVAQCLAHTKCSGRQACAKPFHGHYFIQSSQRCCEEGGEKPRLQRKWLAQGHTAGKWQGWDLDPGLSYSRFNYCTFTKRQLTLVLQMRESRARREEAA